MKKYIMLWVACTLSFMSCGDDDSAPALMPSERGTVTDNDGNTYGWVRIGNLDWTTSNAKNGVPVYELTYYNGFEWWNAFDEEDAEDLAENYFPVYGNLMTCEEAMNTAPAGWRVPTDEDWQQLEQALGASQTDSKGWRGTNLADLFRQEGEGTELAMKHGGVCTWKAVYGWMELELEHVGEYGYYWTSTVDPSYTDFEAAYYRKICYNRGSVERQCGKVDKLMSVRWVRDAQ